MNTRLQQLTQGYQLLCSDLQLQGEAHSLVLLSVLHHKSLVLSSELSSSLSSSSVLASLSLVKTMVQGCNYLHELVGGHRCHCPKCSLSSLSSETSECVSAYSSHKISSSFRTLLHKAMSATEGSWARNQRGYRNQWSLCCSLMVLKIGFQNQCVCNLRPKHPASSCP